MVTSPTGTSGKEPHKPEAAEFFADLGRSFEGILIEDVVAALGRYHADPSSQRSRRELVRASFAAIEGFAWIYREHVADVARTLQVLSLQEQIALSETTIQVTEQGKIAAQPRFVPFTAMLRLVTRIAAKVSPMLEMRFDASEWGDFKRAVAVRNRITHPKTPGDLHLTDPDIATCVDSFFWLLEQCTKVMETTNQALKSHAGQLREMFSKLDDGDAETWALYRAAQEHFSND